MGQQMIHISTAYGPRNNWIKEMFMGEPIKFNGVDEMAPVGHMIWRLPGVHYCKSCEYGSYGIMDYIYGTWWKCRDCGTWGQKNA